MGIGSSYVKVNRQQTLTVDEDISVVKGNITVTDGTVIVPGSSGLQVGSSAPFIDSSGTLTLQNIDALDATTTATILSNMTSETQHRIGCLIVSDMSYAKTLYLPSDATDSSAKSMYDTADSAVYTVPTGKIFLAGKVSYYVDHGYNRGRIGEGTSSNGQISYDQMCFGNGTVGGGNASCPGIFTAGKYVNAESTGNYSLRVPTMLYGIEVSVDGEGTITDDVTVMFNIGGYICENYTELKTLICIDEPTSSSPKTFHEWNGSSWVNYDVPTSKVYIAGAISYWTDYATNNGIIGESATADASLSRQVFMCGNANVNSGFQEVYGRFVAGKWVTAKTTSGFSLRTPTYIYGVEIDE